MHFVYMYGGINVYAVQISHINLSLYGITHLNYGLKTILVLNATVKTTNTIIHINFVREICGRNFHVTIFSMHTIYNYYIIKIFAKNVFSILRKMKIF